MSIHKTVITSDNGNRVHNHWIFAQWNPWKLELSPLMIHEFLNFIQWKYKRKQLLNLSYEIRTNHTQCILYKYSLMHTQNHRYYCQRFVAMTVLVSIKNKDDIWMSTANKISSKFPYYIFVWNSMNLINFPFCKKKKTLDRKLFITIEQVIQETQMQSSFIYKYASINLNLFHASCK